MKIGYSLVLGYWGLVLRPRRIHVSSARTEEWCLALVSVLALLSRITAGFLLPNAEQDGYSYAEIIQRLTKQLETGHFQVSDFYGFWLPGFQTVGTLFNLAVHDPLVAGKVINVLAGALSIVLVFLIARRVTGSVRFSLLAFGLILLDPLHILYSASCMTDVPHACVVLASLWFAMQRKWLGAALFAAVAETIRIESWALILALPLLEWLQDRQISWRVCLILLLPPFGWFVITAIATGSPLAYFAERARYHTEYMQFHAERQGFHWAAIKQDAGFLLLGAGRVVFTAALFGTVGTFRRLVRDRELGDDTIMAPAIYGGAMLGLLLLAYLTKAQPVWLPRYGLIFFAIGLPMFARVLQWIVASMPGRGGKALVVIGVICASLIEMSKQVSTLANVQTDFRAHQQIAATLANDLKAAPADARCFSDDAAVRVLSKLPAERFLRSPFVPASAASSADAFLDWLHRQRIGWLVFFPTEDSVPVKLFPQLSKSHAGSPNFTLIASAHSTFGPDIWLYRVRQSSAVDGAAP